MDTPARPPWIDSIWAQLHPEEAKVRYEERLARIAAREADPFLTVEELNSEDSIETLAKKLLKSRQYRESLLRRIEDDSLPPAVEARLYDYAHGKPVERVEVKDTTPVETGLSEDQLLAKIARLQTAVLELKKDQETAH